MAAAKIAVTIDRKVLASLDRAVKQRKFASRSEAVQEALREKLLRLQGSRLDRECAKLDPLAEQQLAEEGIAEDLKDWPTY